MGIEKVSKEEVTKVIQRFKTVHNLDFSSYAEQSFTRRIEHLLALYNLPSVDALLNLIKNDSILFEKCINDITVNTTEMFRDPDVWLNIKRNIIPILKTRHNINIWHAGCSSGEEVYSMLILLAEENLLDKVKVFATDINTTIIERARSGIYNYRLHNSYFINFDSVVKVNPLNFEQVIDVPYEKYFDIDKINGLFTIKKFLRDVPQFKRHNLVECGLGSYKFDVIFCRNVIIYFNAELQSKVIGNFYQNLFTNGMMLLGNHENIAYLPVAAKFETKQMKGLYYKRGD